MWAVEHEGVEPDLVTTAKGIASGVPMGALIARADLLDAWPPGAHGNTYGGNPLAVAAASATLDVIEQENWPLTPRPEGGAAPGARATWRARQSARPSSMSVDAA